MPGRVMKSLRLCLLLGVTVAAQSNQPPAYPPTAAERQEITAKLADLTRRLDALAAGKTDPGLNADVEVYRKAAEYITRFPEEFFGKSSAAETVKVLDTGLSRAQELEAGAP